MNQNRLNGLQCTKCNSMHSSDPKISSCTHCGGILEVRYNFDRLREFISRSSLESMKGGVWKYFHLLPLETKESIISLNEGETPLIKAKRLGEHWDLGGLYVKDETRNPTGSFKDRPNTVGISKAREFRAQTVALASSGNAAGSLSAYAAKASLRCVVAVPEDIPLAKLSQIIIYGPNVIKVVGNYSTAFNLIKEACKKYGWHNLTSVSSANPYQSEGDKTVAYELCEQMNWQPPDWVVVPLGAGPLLVGAWNGFNDLYKLDLIRQLPKMIGVQASGCAPIVKAFKEDAAEVTAWTEPKTIAHSIADPLVGYAQDGTLTLSRIRDSHGVAESVTDDEMIEAVKTLARREGIFAEPAACATLAVVRKLNLAGVIGRDDEVVSLLTGTGLKNPEPILESLIVPNAINANLVELEKELANHSSTQ